MEDTADRIIRFLVKHTSCTECGTSYHTEDVHVIEQRTARVWILGAVCHDCFDLCLIRAELPEKDAVAMAGARTKRPARAANRAPRPAPGLADELTAAERRRFRSLPPLDSDDLLDMTAFLADFDGDFHTLFDEEATATVLPSDED